MKKRGTGAVINIEGPDKFVVRTKGGRKIKSCRTMASAMKFAQGYLEKTNARSLSVKGARFRYVPEKKAKPVKRAKRRTKKRGRR